MPGLSFTNVLQLNLLCQYIISCVVEAGVSRSFLKSLVNNYICHMKNWLENCKTLVFLHVNLKAASNLNVNPQLNILSYPLL